jgi:hypothetical protein
MDLWFFSRFCNYQIYMNFSFDQNGSKELPPHQTVTFCQGENMSMNAGEDRPFARSR